MTFQTNPRKRQHHLSRNKLWLSMAPCKRADAQIPRENLVTDRLGSVRREACFSKVKSREISQVKVKTSSCIVLFVNSLNSFDKMEDEGKEKEKIKLVGISVGNSKYRIANSGAGDQASERTASEIVENRAQETGTCFVEMLRWKWPRSRHAIVKHETELASCYFRPVKGYPGTVWR